MSSGSPISTAAGCWPSRPGTARRSTPPRQYHDTRSANVDRLPRSTAAAGLRRRRPPPPALLWRASGTTTEVPVGAPPARCTARETMMSGRRRALAAAALGVGCELCALGLLATGGWRLLSAALRPPILTLSVAIGAVQVFALSRGAARYGERLASHDLGLGLQARLRGSL